MYRIMEKCIVAGLVVIQVKHHNLKQQVMFIVCKLLVFLNFVQDVDEFFEGEKKFLVEYNSK